MANCKWCQAQIEWIQVDGRSKALEPGGKTHWCEERRQAPASPQPTHTLVAGPDELLLVCREILVELKHLADAVEHLAVVPYMPHRDEAPLSKPLPWAGGRTNY